MRGMEDPHDIEIAMDGSRLQLVTVGGKDDFNRMAENPGTFGADLDARLTVRIPVKAGVHTLTAATILKSHATRDDLIKPFMRTTIDGLDIMGDPSVDRMTIEGPLVQTGSGETPSRRKIFICKPASASDEQACATKILSSLARMAYRRPADQATMNTLMDFYKRGRAKGNFESGIESALQFVLASPEFLFRIEPDPPGIAPTRHIAWTITRWPRVCRSFCGAAFPMIIADSGWPGQIEGSRRARAAGKAHACGQAIERDDR